MEESIVREFRDLLDPILDQATFGSLSPAQLRDVFKRNEWHDEEKDSTRGAQPHIPDELLSQLTNCLRSLLEEFIDSKTDHIGHAFPVDAQRSYPIDRNHGLRRETFQPNGLLSIACVTMVEDFAKGLIKGAAVVGSERVTQLLSGWLRGKPIKYRTMALLNGLPVNESLAPGYGVGIEPLPLSTDALSANLPRPRGVSAADYLGRTTVSIDSSVAPALFHPQTEPSLKGVQANSVGDVDFDTVCQALSLESDSYMDTAFFWNDYQELAAFSLTGGESTWSTGNAYVKTRSTPMSRSIDLSTGVIKLEPMNDQRMPDLSDSQVARTLKALKILSKSDKTRIAVSRWVKSKDSGENLVDRFIDLRIALESLYLQNISDDKYRGEMRFRLALAGAWHLGTDFEERKKIFRSLRDAYDVASKAVHSGDLEYSENQQLLSTTQDLCRCGILKLLRGGPPSDWGNLLLGVDCEKESI
ncbi:MAG: HEPN domain-containing protein [Caldilineaceae bacterium]|nr:HEPN domain-containing protein [Caldilineaceae bacterium]